MRRATNKESDTLYGGQGGRHARLLTIRVSHQLVDNQMDALGSEQ